MTRESQHISTDFLVLGSGLAGLTFALHAAGHGQVTILTKAELFESNTSYAQGGIAAAIGESDSWKLHEEDTLTAGAGLCDPGAVRFLVQNAPDSIHWLATLGVRFDREEGATSLTDWALGREGGHSRNRIVHHADRTGWEVERAMNAAVRAHPNVKIFENAFATDLLQADGRCVGARAVLAEEREVDFLAAQTMLATGGAGRLYQHSTNPRIATGDGLALALRAGVPCSDLEFVQFHPTTLYHPQLRSFLITEAARGEGGTLRTHDGDRFMYDFDEQLELAPRDIVARAIDEEMRRRDTWCVYLDLTHLPRERIERHFPTIIEKLNSVGIQPHRHWIPIVPAQHYMCGGVITDLTAQTGMPGLLASGEVARTGVHGANRLASNSLLEAMVFAKAGAQAAVATKIERPTHFEEPQVRRCVPESDAIRLRRVLQKIMMERVGIVRRDAGMNSALMESEALLSDFAALPEAPYSQYSMEAHNLLTVAPHLIRAALARRENVGLHFNADLVQS